MSVVDTNSIILYIQDKLNKLSNATILPPPTGGTVLITEIDGA